MQGPREVLRKRAQGGLTGGMARYRVCSECALYRFFTLRTDEIPATFRIRSATTSISENNNDRKESRGLVGTNLRQVLRPYVNANRSRPACGDGRNARRNTSRVRRRNGARLRRNLRRRDGVAQSGNRRDRRTARDRRNRRRKPVSSGGGRARSARLRRDRALRGGGDRRGFRSDRRRGNARDGRIDASRTPARQRDWSSAPRETVETRQDLQTPPRARPLTAPSAIARNLHSASIVGVRLRTDRGRAGLTPTSRRMGIP